MREGTEAAIFIPAQEPNDGGKQIDGRFDKKKIPLLADYSDVDRQGWKSRRSKISVEPGNGGGCADNGCRQAGSDRDT